MGTIKNKSSASILKLIDIRQTKEYAKHMQNIGWQVDRLTNTQYPIQYFYKKIPFTPFTTLKILRSNQQLSQNQIKNLKSKHKALIIKNEPLIIKNSHKEIKNNNIYFVNNKKSSWPLTPTKTIWINLHQNLDSIKNNFKSKHRYNLKRTYHKFNLNTKLISGKKISYKNLQDFYNLWSHNPPHSWWYKPKFHQLNNLIKSFGDKCFIIFSYQNNSTTILASAIILTSPNMSFYWHNASTSLGKELFAPTRIIWEAIKKSKENGLRIFDFEGIWDERYPDINKTWKGFGRFKEGFAKKSIRSV